MAVDVEIEYPDENEVHLADKFFHESGGSVSVRGRGNRLVIEAPFLANTARFFLTGGAHVHVRADSNLNALSVYAVAEGAHVEIGAWTSFNGTCLITAHEAARITIGDYCLFGDGCRIAGSDVHRILDTATGERINPPGDVAVGEHVWVAPNALITRNARIGRDSIVGFGALVNAAFPPNVSLAGVPARVVREGVTWEF